MIYLANFISFGPLFLILHATFLVLFKKWLGPVGTFYSSVLVFSFVIISTLHELYTMLLLGGYYYVDFGRWFFCLDLIDSHLLFCVDSLALTASTLVLVLTVFALYFGVEYMYREAFINRLLYLLNLFATSVVFLFFSFDYFLIMLSWECIGLFSLLLVNFYSTRIYTIKAALKTFVFSRISDTFMFISFILTLVVYNTTDLSIIFLQVPFFAFHYSFFGTYGAHFLTVFSFLLATSGCIKAAQFFSHVWLPDAMEAPTPASALIHSSTLVVAGVFLIIRFSIVFEFTLFTNQYLILLGGVTLAFGAVTAIFQNDIKKLVAYSTISQIGYLVCGCGFCCYEEVLVYLIVHALNKAFLFVLVGYLVHFFNANTDMRQMGSSYLYSFDISVMLFGVCFNLTGLPYSAGFIGKEFLLFQTLKEDFISFFVRGCWLVSFFFTPIYMFILVFIVLFGPKKGVLTTYRDSWLNTFYEGILSLTSNSLKDVRTFYKSLVFRFQYSLLTSRVTIYLLFFFWCFFFFFGEFLLLLVFKYNTIGEWIPSSFLTYLKTNLIFSLASSNNSLTGLIFFYIIFFAICSFLFLLNLRLNSYSLYLRLVWQNDLLFILLISLLFSHYTLFYILAYLAIIRVLNFI